MVPATAKAESARATSTEYPIGLSKCVHNSAKKTLTSRVGPREAKPFIYHSNALPKKEVQELGKA